MGHEGHHEHLPYVKISKTHNREIPLRHLFHTFAPIQATEGWTFIQNNTLTVIIMKKWYCNVCGYTHKGEEAPERCPQCGAQKSLFSLKKESNGYAFSILFIIMILAAIFFTFFACRSSVTVDNSAVSTVNLNKYLGQWYEVARFDHSFERDLVECTANYVPQEDGTIKVVNRGKKDGEWKTSVGKAKMTDDPGILRVSFFGPFYSDYRIMMLAPDYSYALIGGNGDNYLWILSRTPKLKEEAHIQIVKEAQRRGYNTDNLIWVEQKS